MRYHLLLSLLLLSGCVSTPQHVKAPSTAKVQSGINKAKDQISAARDSVKEAARYNDISAEDARRIDAKAAVLLKYLPQ